MDVPFGIILNCLSGKFYVVDVSTIDCMFKMTILKIHSIGFYKTQICIVTTT